MGDVTKFNRCYCNYIFNVLLMCLLISEIFIFFYYHVQSKIELKKLTLDIYDRKVVHLNFVFV